jgi:hypothetical protein
MKNILIFVQYPSWLERHHSFNRPLFFISQHVSETNEVCINVQLMEANLLRRSEPQPCETILLSNPEEMAIKIEIQIMKSYIYSENLQFKDHL